MSSQSQPARTSSISITLIGGRALLLFQLLLIEKLGLFKSFLFLNFMLQQVQTLLLYFYFYAQTGGYSSANLIFLNKLMSIEIESIIVNLLYISQQYNLIMQNQQIRIEHTFSQTGLDPFICRLLSHKKYKNPTPIQYFSIKTGIDHPQLSLICRSKSGTGKTIAYISLLINFFLSLNQIEQKTYSIILLPTRELAVQVYQTLKQILDYAGQVKASTETEKQMKKKLCDLNIMLTIGGISFEDDRKKYRQNASKIIICTVGRIWEMIKSNIIIMGKEMLLVFDEGDKLLSNVDQKLNKVISMLPKTAKWLVYSATYSNKIISDIAKTRKCIYVQTLFKNNELDVVITDKILDFIKSNPNLLPETLPQTKSVQYEQNQQNSQNLHLLNIKKYQIKINPEENDSIFDSKIKKLSELLNELQYQKCLIFVEKKSFLQQISQNLNNFEHVLIHGSLSQAARFRMMNQINNTKIIIASDLLSRGIDIKLDLVILFDAKQSDTFWHRIGRTGRYGRTGVAISLDQIDDKQWIEFDKEEVNNILSTIELEQKKEWYGGHLTEIGKWEQFDEKKEAKNNYKYFNEQKMESRIKQISKIEQKIKIDSECEQKNRSTCSIMEKVKNAKSKQQLQNLIKQIISCKHCMELMKSTTELTGYQFQILRYLQVKN